MAHVLWLNYEDYKVYITKQAFGLKVFVLYFSVPISRFFLNEKYRNPFRH